MYIYTITSLKKHDIGDGLNRLVYVGSCKDFKIRVEQHRRDCFNKNSRIYNIKVYTMIREIGWDNFVFEVILVMSDDTTDEELLKMEQHYIDKFESKKSLNTRGAIGFDKTEWQKKNRIQNREELNRLQRDYRSNNRQKYNDTQSEYRSKNRQMINYLQQNRRLMKKTIRAFCNISIYE